MNGMARLLTERQRQNEECTFINGCDVSAYTDRQLVRAAECYLLYRGDTNVPNQWPFAEKDWEPGDRIDNLAKAGALLVAEMDRLLASHVPKEPGWYWYRSSKLADPTCVQVARDSPADGGRLYCMDTYIEDCGGTWGARIPDPEGL